MAATDTSPDAPRLLRTRGLRALVDGLVAVVLPAYLLARGFNATEVGAVVTATLLGLGGRHPDDRAARRALRSRPPPAGDGRC